MCSADKPIQHGTGGSCGSRFVSWRVWFVLTTFAHGNPTYRDIIIKTLKTMKHVFRLFALMAVFLMGSVTTEASKTLTYDFATIHPSSQLRIDQGFKTIEGNYAYWTGQYAGLFGRKIAFATDAYPVLHENGGLVDYHNSRKMYLMNMNAGDKVTFYYTGLNPSISYHTVGTAKLQGMELWDVLDSGVTYSITTSGNLCVANHWNIDGDFTLIRKIVIESVKETETIDVSNGMATFCSTVPLDFSGTPALKAFVATGYENGKFIFKQVNYVPSDTGFLVVLQGGSASSVTVPVGRSPKYGENYISGNLFTGKLTRTQIQTPSGKKCYMFGIGDGAVGIYPTAASFYCEAKKAYLTVSQ